ncbi:hypothetical protein WA158_001877 [Blastocystis sp. Blastoise]
MIEALDCFISHTKNELGNENSNRLLTSNIEECLRHECLTRKITITNYKLNSKLIADVIRCISYVLSDEDQNLCFDLFISKDGTISLQDESLLFKKMYKLCCLYTNTFAGDLNISKRMVANTLKKSLNDKKKNNTFYKYFNMIKADSEVPDQGNETRTKNGIEVKGKDNYNYNVRYIVL